MPIIIRAARLDDLEALVQLNCVVQELHYQRRPDQYAPVSGVAIAAWFRDVLLKRESATWLAIHDDRVVGYVLTLVHARAASPFAPARSWLELDQVCVDPEFRNSGVATALLSHTIAVAKASGRQSVELTTWEFNAPAQALFRKLGFNTKYLRLELNPLAAREPAGEEGRLP